MLHPLYDHILILYVKNTWVRLNTWNWIICIIFRFYENFITVTIFHTIISPLIFNIIPAILSLILNSFLIKEVLNYYEVHKCITSEVQLSNRKNKQTKASIFTCGFSHNIVNWSEKSHYFVIAIVSLWLVLTEIPYFTFKSYFYFFCDSKFSKTADIKKIQFILTMFFISNHCINFFIYFFFYSMFRKSIFNVFCSKLCCVRFREPLNQERFLGKKTPVIKKDGNWSWYSSWRIDFTIKKWFILKKNRWIER